MIEWTPDMIATLHKMQAEQPRPTLQTIGERLGVDRSVVAKYCQLHNLPMTPGVRKRQRSNATMILGRAAAKARR
jgi:hypothetical protein